jgi:hypothetical protein
MLVSIIAIMIDIINSSYIPNSTVDSLVLNRVVSLDITNMGILCLIISLLSVIVFYVIIKYMKNNKEIK